MPLEREAEAVLASECDAFCRYLAGLPADPYITAKYVEAHRVYAVEAASGHRPDERLLVRLASHHPVLATLADGYASVWARKGLLRRKLILTLALLEVRAATAPAVDVPSRGTVLGLLARLGVMSAGFVVSVAIGSLAFGPVMLGRRVLERRQLQPRHSVS
jgi:hypothetical protein